MNFAATASSDEIQAITLQDERTIKYIDGKTVVKVIVVPKKIVNIVLKRDDNYFKHEKKYYL